MVAEELRMNNEERGMHIIAQNVRIRRKAKHFRVIDLAYRAKLSKSLISAIENEHVNNISLKTLEQLAEGLDTDIASLMTPISLEEYNCIAEDIFDAEEMIVNSINEREMEKSFYPPLARYSDISSMLELILVLPLINPWRLYDIYLRIKGRTDSYEYYISELYTRAWKDVPDSPEKRYVEKELQYIHEKRMGNGDFKIKIDDEYKEEYNAYSQMLKRKSDFIEKLSRLFDDDPFFSGDEEDSIKHQKKHQKMP